MIGECFVKAVRHFILTMLALIIGDDRYNSAEINKALIALRMNGFII